MIRVLHMAWFLEKSPLLLTEKRKGGRKEGKQEKRTRKTIDKKAKKHIYFAP